MAGYSGGIGNTFDPGGGGRSPMTPPRRPKGSVNNPHTYPPVVGSGVFGGPVQGPMDYPGGNSPNRPAGGGMPGRGGYDGSGVFRPAPGETGGGMGGMRQNASGFGNQGSTGFGGAGWSDMTPTLGGGMGGGTTPNSPPVAGQAPTMNTPTGGFNPTAPSPPPPQTQSPTPNPGQDTRYPPGAGVFNYAGTDAYRNSTGDLGPSSPTTPNLNGGGFGGGGFGGGTGGGYQPPTRGTGPITNKYNNTLNITGPTSTSITKGDEYAQKTPKKTFKQPKVAMGQKMIGDPKMAMQQLSAMQQTPFMRRA